MFEIWDALLNTLSQFVIPDWGALIALIPIAIMTLVIVVFAILFWRLLSAPRANRGFQRIEPATPAGIHMPGPSLSPILAAVGGFMLVLGVILGGAMLVVGGIAFALTLLYWLAEAIRVYDRENASSVPPLPVVAHDGPPAGVHMPGPSFRPFLGAIGATLLMLGLVFGGWLLAVGAIALVVTLLGWLVDAVKEYRKTVEADQTGHLENIPAPRTPALLLGTLAVLLVGGIVLQTGILPPKSANGEAGTPGASGAPPVGSGGPPAATASAAPLPAGDVTVTALAISFVEKTITAPADAPFTIVFDNQAAGVAHDVDLIDTAGTKVFNSEPIVGPSSTVYDVGALPAGTYTFICSLHPIPDMTGTATLQ
jgi:plastocyanin